MTTLIMLIATGFYAGYLPKVPGTWGSLVGLILYFFLSKLSLSAYLMIVAAVLVIGFFAAGSAEKILDRRDPGAVVIDEIGGMLITLTLAPPDILAWLLGFAIFRFFDILKPFPIGWLEKRTHGGGGIMLDDVLAGLYSLIALQIIWHIAF